MNISRQQPLKQIRQFCLWCCDGNANEVRECPAEFCPLHKYRFGRKEIKGSKSGLRMIRQKCVDCSSDSYKEVEYCEFSYCPLFIFRFGKNPFRKKIPEYRRKGMGEALNAVRPRKKEIAAESALN